MRYYVDVTEEQLAQARKWKELADGYNLSIDEIRDLVYHIEAIRRIIDKGPRH